MIELARHARGLTQKALAERMECAQGTLSKFEQGLAPVTEEWLQNLSIALHYPASFFKQPGGTYPSGIKYRRARTRLSARLRDRIDAENNIRARIIGELLRSVEIEHEDIPSMPVEDYGSPQEVARALRERWKVERGPIRNLSRLFERNGGIVILADFHTPKFDGVYYMFPNLPAIVFLNNGQPGDRLRFSLAHEIGHLVMHQLPTIAEEAEPQANEFAAEFLMPAADIRRHLFNLDLAKAANLKLVWGVAMSALIKRASDLRTITPNRYKTLMIQLRKACKGVHEPDNVSIPQEQPRMLLDLVQMHRNELGYSTQELSAVLHLYEDEFIARYEPKQKTAKIIRLDNARRWS